MDVNDGQRGEAAGGKGLARLVSQFPDRSAALCVQCARCCLPAAGEMHDSLLYSDLICYQPKLTFILKQQHFKIYIHIYM